MATANIAPILSDSKVCPRCRELKPLDGFVRSKNRPNGRHVYCLSCARSFSRARAARKRAAKEKQISELDKSQIAAGDVFQCTGCLQTKAILHFRYDSRKPRGHDTRCKTCESTSARRLYKERLAIRASMIEAGLKIQCSACKETKQVTHFTADATSANGSRYKCRVCFSAYHNDWRARRQSGENTSPKRSPLMRAHGITRSTFDLMMDAQGHACAICRRALEHVFPNKKINIDHDHKTGCVRGLLCSPCNTAIGLLREDEKILRSAMSYLAKHKT